MGTGLRGVGGQTTPLYAIYCIYKLNDQATFAVYLVLGDEMREYVIAFDGVCLPRIDMSIICLS